MKASLRVRLFGLLGLFSLVFAGFLTLAWQSMTERVEDSVYAQVLATKDVVADVLPPPLFVIEAWLVAHQALDTPDEARRTALAARWESLAHGFAAREQQWRTTPLEPRLKAALLEQVAPKGQRFFDDGRRLFAALKEQRRDEARHLLDAQLRPLFEEQRLAVERAVQLAEEVERSQRLEAASAVRSVKWTLAGVGLIGLLIALLVGWWIASGFRARLESLIVELEAAAQGDLRVSASRGAPVDEVGVVHQALERTLLRMAEAIEAVQRVSRQVESESSALTATSSELQRGVSEQASSSEETSASIEQLGANAQQTATIAQRASGLSADSSEAVRATGDVLASTQAAMRKLSETSARVQEIVSTVDEMAFQTNLLALNAAVEAARAGEAGRGFAVVAHEVRALAQRSAAAARDIRKLLEGSAEQVSTSTGLVDQSFRALERAGAAVKEVTALMGQLATAAREQSSGVQEISRASVSSDGVSQRTASQANALADAATRLSSSASHLAKLSATFQTSVTPSFEPGLMELAAAPHASSPAPRGTAARPDARVEAR